MTPARGGFERARRAQGSHRAFLFAVVVVTASAPVDAAPTTPSRRDLAEAVQAVQPAVLACDVRDLPGASVNVTMTFASSGRVVAVRLAPSLNGTPVGACIARAAFTVHVPPFTEPRFTVNYPFHVR